MIAMTSALSASGARAQCMLVHQWPDPLHHFGNAEQSLHARKVDAGLVDKVLDQS